MPNYRTHDDLIHEAFREAMTPRNLLLIMLRPKLEKQGVHLTDDQLNNMVDQLEKGINPVSIQLDEGQYLSIGIPSDVKEKSALTVDLSEQIERLGKHFPEVMSETILKLLEDFAVEMYQNILDVSSTGLKYEREAREVFRSALWSRWEQALDKLDVFISVANEAGSDIASGYYQSSIDGIDYKLEVLIKLHARALQIAREISVLLSEGYADGAHARWRSLHEVAVISKFIFDNDQDLAERYLRHRVMDAKKGAEQHVEYANRLNEPPPSQEEIANLVDLA